MRKPDKRKKEKYLTISYRYSIVHIDPRKYFLQAYFRLNDRIFCAIFFRCIGLLHFRLDILLDRSTLWNPLPYSLTSHTIFVNMIDENVTE